MQKRLDKVERETENYLFIISIGQQLSLERQRCVRENVTEK